MNRNLKRLRRQITKGPTHNEAPYDRYTWNNLAWSAKWFVTQGCTEEERKLGAELSAIATRKSEALG